MVNKLDEAIEREVRPWLDLVDSLRAQGIQDELSLPQVRRPNEGTVYMTEDTTPHAPLSNCYLFPPPFPDTAVVTLFQPHVQG